MWCLTVIKPTNTTATVSTIASLLHCHIADGWQEEACCAQQLPGWCGA
jgi:hypothetical protein